MYKRLYRPACLAMFIILVTVSLTSASALARLGEAPARQPLKNLAPSPGTYATPFYGKVPNVSPSSRITFWYGAVNDANLATLKTYDIVVLEPTLRVLNLTRNEFYLETLTVNQVRQLQAGVDGSLGNADDVIVLGYISVGEMLSTIIPGSSGHMTIAKGIELGLLPAGYSGPSGPVHGPNPWNFDQNGNYINVEGGAIPDGTYEDGYAGYANLNIASDYSSWGSRLNFTNQNYMPWYMDQQGTWVNDSRYIYGGYWKNGDGTIDVNKYFGGGYINAGDPAWQKFVLFQVEKLVHDIGFDGVFLDTVDTPDPVGGAGPTISWGPRGNFGWTAKGMLELVEKIKALDPTKVVASNRGYWYFNPDEGTSQFADRYRHAINMFITETWYYNIWCPCFFDNPPSANWITNPSDPNYRTRDNFGGFWKDYMNAHANQADGFNIVIIDFQVPAGGLDTWMNQVIINSGYLGYDVAGATHFNSAIYTQSRDWLNSHGFPSPSQSGLHTDQHGGFSADGTTGEWNAETPIYSDPAGTKRGITKVFAKFVSDQFFMMIESLSAISWPTESIYFDYDQDGPSGWNVFWPVSPDARVYIENNNKTYLVPHSGSGTGETFHFLAPSHPTNNGWPVNTAQNTTRFEVEFDREYIFDAVVGQEIWVWFRVANFGGSSVKFVVPALGPTPTPTRTPTPCGSCPTNTPTNTPVPTNTPTNTPVPSNTPTNTPIVPTATRTPTPTAGGAPIFNQQATNDATNVYYQFNYTGTYSFYRIYIDTDQSTGTGFQTGGVGANYLLENGNLYSYSGTGTNWSWSLIKAVTYSSTSGLAQWTVARADIGQTATPNADDLLFQVETPLYTTAKYTHTYSGGGPTSTPTNTLVVTNTPTNTSVPTNTPTNTPLGPTNTPTNTPVATNTPTNTPIPPTNTPTNTPVGPTATPTNTPVPGGIVIDGSFSDWTGIPAYATDPNDAGGGSSDAKAVYLTSSGGVLYLRAEVWGTYSLSIVNILYIDTDGNKATGYSAGGWTSVGAEYRIVHTTSGFPTPTLQVHTGAAGSDTWNTVKTISGAFSGANAEYAVAYADFSPALVAGGQIGTLFRASQDAAPDFWAAYPPRYTLQ